MKNICLFTLIFVMCIPFYNCNDPKVMDEKGTNTDTLIITDTLTPDSSQITLNYPGVSSEGWNAVFVA